MRSSSLFYSEDQSPRQKEEQELSGITSLKSHCEERLQSRKLYGFSVTWFYIIRKRGGRCVAIRKSNPLK